MGSTAGINKLVQNRPGASQGTRPVRPVFVETKTPASPCPVFVIPEVPPAERPVFVLTQDRGARPVFVPPQVPPGPRPVFVDPEVPHNERPVFVPPQAPPGPRPVFVEPTTQRLAQRRHHATADAIDVVLLGAECWLVMVIAMIGWCFVPMLWGWSAHTVSSGSMEQALTPADVVIANTSKTVQKNHIVVVNDPQSPSGSVVHRVVEVHDDGTFITRGDANQSNDQTTRSPDDVVGVARVVVPQAGRASMIAAGKGRAGDYAWCAVTLLAAGVIIRSYRRNDPEPSAQNTP